MPKHAAHHIVQKTQSGVWVIATALLLTYVIATSFSSGKANSAQSLSEDEIKALVEPFIQQNLVPAGVAVSVKNVTKESGVYKVSVSLAQGAQNQVVESYVTADGKIFMMQAIPITESNETAPAKPAAPPAETFEKNDKPQVELYVMSFCPYGVEAENAMKPVADLLGNKIDLKVRFIANVGGNTPDSVDSLHGAPEAQEDMRQVCVMKNYNSTTYWKYLSNIDANCYSLYRDTAKMDACWKSAALSAGIDAAKIASCANSTAAVELMKADEALTQQYGVRGSPTIRINGKAYSGARSAEAFKSAICAAFTTLPAECGEVIQSTGAEASAEPHNCG